MRTLVDASVLSLSLRRSKDAVLNHDQQTLVSLLTEMIEDGRFALIGPIRQEVLYGIREAGHFEKLRTTLAAFPDEPLSQHHFEEAARLFSLCRSRGVSCGSIDMMICAMAVEKRWAILTAEAGMNRCIAVLQAEGLLG